MPTVPQVLATLAGRFDATAFDAPLGAARLRLEVTGEGEWDAVVKHGLLGLGPANGSPDARLIADRETWRLVADDVRGGMDGHLELDCGHVPQLEVPRPTHEAILELFAERALLHSAR